MQTLNRIGRNFVVACILTAGLLGVVLVLAMLLTIGFLVAGGGGLLIGCVMGVIVLLTFAGIVEDSPFFGWADRWTKQQ